MGEIIKPLATKLGKTLLQKNEKSLSVGLFPPVSVAILSPKLAPGSPLESAICGPNQREVQNIVDSKIHRKKTYYMVLWTTGEMTWEQKQNLHEYVDLIEQFHEIYHCAPGSFELVFQDLE